MRTFIEDYRLEKKRAATRKRMMEDIALLLVGAIVGVLIGYFLAGG